MNRCISLLCLLLTALAMGCSSMSPRGPQLRMPGTAQDAARAAWTALRDPMVWGPAAGAAVFLVADADASVSDWAVEETPLFGSPEDAASFSDDARLWLFGAFTGSAALAMLDADAGAAEPAVDAGRFLAVQYGAAGGALATTYVLKRAVGRERPNGSSDLSMPSGHATHAFAYAGWWSRNLDYLAVDARAKPWLRGSGYTLAGLTAWARVEAERHYPSDVLMGTAIANFFVRWFDEMFFVADPGGVVWIPQAERDGVALTARWQF